MPALALAAMSASATATVALAVLGSGLAALAGALAGCGSAGASATGRAPRPAHHATAAGGDPRAAPAGSPGHAVEVADPQEAASYPAPANTRHAAAATPARAVESFVAAGAQSDAEVKAELQQMQAVERSAKQAQQQHFSAVAGGSSIGGNGTIPIPQQAPEPIQRVIAGANEIADFPYVFGGGHSSFVDSAYDCSGSVSYALAAGGMLSAPEASGELEHWGAPGPGRYLTVLANAGHAYMYVDGILYDTAGRSGVFASRWQVGAVSNAGFVARHWPGL